MFGLISINYLFGFNIKDNGIRCYNFDIVPCFELSILLLLQLSKIKCGDRSINGPVGFGIDSGLRGLRPTRGHHTPRHCASEDDRVRGRLGRGLTVIQSQN